LHPPSPRSAFIPVHRTGYSAGRFHKSGTFTTADLAGTWSANLLSVGDGANTNTWSYGTFVISSSGTSTQTVTASSNGATGTDIKTFSIASDGTITQTGSTFHGQMSSGKNMIVFTVTDSVNNRYFLGVLVKAGATYSQTDLTGTWAAHLLTAQDTHNKWAYGTFIIDQTGNYPAIPWTASDVSSTDPGGQFLLSSSGAVTVPGVSDGFGFLSSDKNCLVIVGNTNSGQARTLLVLLKR
jgi:hypothetical protein